MAKGEPQNGGNKNTKHVKFSKKRMFFTPDTHTYQGVKKRSFFGKFGVLCILVTSVLRFALLPYYRRIHPTMLASKNDHYTMHLIRLNKTIELLQKHLYPN